MAADVETHPPLTMPAPVVIDGLTVRPWIVDDAPALHHAVMANVEHLRPFMPWVSEEPVSPAGREAFIRSRHDEAEAGNLLGLGVFRREQVVGTVGLHRRISEGGLEIGYWIHVDHVGRGYATVAAAVATDVAFTQPGIDHVEIHHDRANTVSRRVPEKLGFELVRTDLPVEPLAPGETGVRWVWRMTADCWTG